MASISSHFSASSSHRANQNTIRSPNKNLRFLFSFSSSSHRFFPSPTKDFSGVCRCHSRSDSQPPQDDFIRPKWGSLIQNAFNNAVNRWNDYINLHRIAQKKTDADAVAEAANEEEKKEKRVDWDWEQWKRHFEEVEEQERIVSILKSQLSEAVHREDYEDAAKLKVAIAAAARKDTVGGAISCLNRAVEEERYQDAAFFRDHAGAGLVGWWAGISEDSSDPYGRIIHISAEYGRYVARSYSSRWVHYF